MYINLETKECNTIEAYSETEIRINAQTYQQNLIVSRNALITHWEIQSIKQLNQDMLSPLLQHHPEIMLIGHASPHSFVPISLISQLAKQHIAMECMLIGPACRTFNILLNEKRPVVLGIIWGTY